MSAVSPFAPPASIAGAEPAPSGAIRFGAFPITETHSFPPPAGAECWAYVTLNTEIALSLARSPGLQALLRSTRARISVDGQWIWWALQRKYPGRRIRKLSGSDLIYTLAAHCAAEGRRLLLLGSGPENNARAVAAMRLRWPGLDVQGHAPLFHSDDEVGSAALQLELLSTIRGVRPDYVVLGLGAGKEHGFVAQALPALDGLVSGVLCFGGAIDMASGVVRRAPLLVQQLGLEGWYRVWQQPARLGRMLRLMRILPLLARGRY